MQSKYNVRCQEHSVPLWEAPALFWITWRQGDPLRRVPTKSMINAKNTRCHCWETPALRVLGCPGGKPTHCRQCNRTRRHCGEGYPWFGLPGDKPTHCKQCNRPYTVDVKSTGIAAGSSSHVLDYMLLRRPVGKRIHCSECKLGGAIVIIVVVSLIPNVS